MRNEARDTERCLPGWDEDAPDTERCPELTLLSPIPFKLEPVLPQGAEPVPSQEKQ